MKKVFVDGSAGTTGLRIFERLSARKDVSLKVLSEEKRKNIEARAEAISSADVAFLCLPDAAAIEAVALCTSVNTVIIDTSTAHRTNGDFVYGFPELRGMREKIAASRRIANPGCHASGFVALVAPLREAGVLGADARLSCFSLTGYSGGGKKMIAEYESEDRPTSLNSPKIYSLGQTHKHLPEMVKYAKLEVAPIFVPTVAPYYSGMQVNVPLFAADITCHAREIGDIYREYYKKGIVRFVDTADAALFAASMSGNDGMCISVSGNDERLLLTATFDNLGKGASGAAVQNMNVVLGIDETTSLVL